ncbi:hypothetical protein [Chamaesiphon sp. VAR_69_metabat_338]|uniref:hypothetical protein n=1 Tax=Chamaesiphon sp. VAR_69_metabat_338 TaxID=2964704 RepID=UPI00286D8A9F|nr:hypothetical protein [Chamaesiphon sp. VAR_69_metabat_338]
MLQPRHSKPSLFISNLPICQSLPTGNGFGGSTLNLDLDWESIWPLANPTPPIVASPQPAIVQQQSPLLVEAVKIICLALWLWCLLGANFCVNCVGAIANVAPQSAGADRC